LPRLTPSARAQPAFSRAISSHQDLKVARFRDLVRAQVELSSRAVLLQSRLFNPALVRLAGALLARVAGKAPSGGAPGPNAGGGQEAPQDAAAEAAREEGLAAACAELFACVVVRVVGVEEAVVDQWMRALDAIANAALADAWIARVTAQSGAGEGSGQQDGGSSGNSNGGGGNDASGNDEEGFDSEVVSRACDAALIPNARPGRSAAPPRAGERDSLLRARLGEAEERLAAAAGRARPPRLPAFQVGGCFACGGGGGGGCMQATNPPQVIAGAERAGDGASRPPRRDGRGALDAGRPLLRRAAFAERVRAAG
jgi:hypothetical protein